MNDGDNDSSRPTEHDNPVSCLEGSEQTPVLVKNDIPDRSIAFGTPARISGRVEIDGANVKLCYDSEA